MLMGEIKKKSIKKMIKKQLKNKDQIWYEFKWNQMTRA